jgi:SAM-dependent methyltransferase
MKVANNPKFEYFSGIYLNDLKRSYYNKLLKKIFYGEYKLKQVVKCYCGGNDLETLSLEDRFGLPFGTKICMCCGLILLSPRLCEDCLNNFYDEIYWGLILGGVRQQELETSEVGKGSSIFDFIKEYIDFSNSKPLDVGEIGCGSGVKLAEIQKQCSLNGKITNCNGCDYSSEAVRLSRNKGLIVIQGGVEALEDKKFDILILSHVVEHFSNLDRELGRIKSLMKHGGIVYVEVPGVCDLENKHEYSYNYNIYSVLAHMYNFNLTSLRYVMESNGFKFVKGNEYVRSLFQISTDNSTRVDITKNYKNTMECLDRAIKKQMRMERKPSRMFKKFIKSGARRLIS